MYFYFWHPKEISVLKHATRATLHDDIMEQMITAIKEKHWEPGTKLPGEQSLAATFGVSRACIREVLKALAHSGVLDARPGQGTFLTLDADRILSGDQLSTVMFSEFSYAELTEIRRLMEGQAAYWAAERASPESIEKLENILLSAGKGNSKTEVHKEFHKMIVEMSGNRLLMKLHDTLRTEILSQKEFHFTVLPVEDLDQQWEIFNAVKAHAPEKAWKAMLKHVDLYWKKLGFELSKS
jgi:GntR family transcriptional repressor for pyruvate dehydrogenase complex